MNSYPHIYNCFPSHQIARSPKRRVCASFGVSLLTKPSPPSWLAHQSPVSDRPPLAPRSAMDDSCAVCADALEWVAYGPCGHREVCSTCVVRLRFVLADRRCCICKTECSFVFVTKVSCPMVLPQSVAFVDCS